MATNGGDKVSVFFIGHLADRNLPLFPLSNGELSAQAMLHHFR